MIVESLPFEYCFTIALWPEPLFWLIVELLSFPSCRTSAVLLLAAWRMSDSLLTPPWSTVAVLLLPV